MERWRVCKLGDLLQFTRQPGLLLWKWLTLAVTAGIVVSTLLVKTVLEQQYVFAVAQGIGLAGVWAALRYFYVQQAREVLIFEHSTDRFLRNGVLICALSRMDHVSIRSVDSSYGSRSLSSDGVLDAVLVDGSSVEILRVDGSDPQCETQRLAHQIASYVGITVRAG